MNVLGCFIMGLLVELMALKLNVGNEMRAFLTTGILGGFTTFSAFSLDFALLVERKSYARWPGPMPAASVILSLAAVFAGTLSGTCSGTMTEVKRHVVTADEAGMRLDRWFKVHFPQVTFAYLNKLTRTGQVRVGGARAKTSTRLEAEQEIRVPPLAFDTRPADAPKADVKPLTPRGAPPLRHHGDPRGPATSSCSNKPSGFAVQGGTKTHHHLDGLLMGLGVELGERPLLVHRLDRDTSGVIVVAKRRAVASALGKLFATRAVKKTYWAVVKGVPKPAQGRIEVALIKAKGPDGDRMRASHEGEEEDEQRAVTHLCRASTRRRRWRPGCR